jgi:hypothetical protein
MTKPTNKRARTDHQRLTELCQVIEERGPITGYGLSIMPNMSYGDVWRRLKEAEKKGLILGERIAKNNATRWRIVPTWRDILIGIAPVPAPAVRKCPAPMARVGIGTKWAHRMPWQQDNEASQQP